MKTRNIILIAILLGYSTTFAQSPPIHLYISKQTGEFHALFEGVGTKTTDRYENGCVEISSTGPILFGVLPNDQCIGINQSKSWDGWVKPDVWGGPPPGESEDGTLTLQYDVHYSRPIEFPGGVNFPGGVIISEVVEGQYSCENCPYHLDGGVHDLIHKVGAISKDFIVHSIKIFVPDVCVEVGKPKTVFAETHLSNEGTVTWEAQDNNVIIYANNREATVLSNKSGVYKIIATLNILGVTYKSEFVVTVCEVDLIAIDPIILYKHPDIGSERINYFREYSAKVLPIGTQANVSMRYGEVELDKTLVSDGDKVTVRIKNNEKYGLRITHECFDSIYKDKSIGSNISVKVTKTKAITNERTGELTINCTALGSPFGGVFQWNINGKSAKGQNVSVTFELCEWNFMNGDEIPISVTYTVEGKSGYDETSIIVDPLPLRNMGRVAVAISPINGEIIVDCHTDPNIADYWNEGECKWEVKGKNLEGKNVRFTFGPHEWDIKNGESNTVLNTRSICGESTTNVSVVEFPPVLSVEITKVEGQGNLQTGEVTISCDANGLPKGGTYKWEIGGEVIEGKSVTVIIDVCDWDYIKGQKIPISVEYDWSGLKTYSDTSYYAEKMPYSYHWHNCP